MRSDRIISSLEFRISKEEASLYHHLPLRWWPEIVQTDTDSAPATSFNTTGQREVYLTLKPSLLITDHLNWSLWHVLWKTVLDSLIHKHLTLYFVCVSFVSGVYTSAGTEKKKKVTDQRRSVSKRRRLWCDQVAAEARRRPGQGASSRPVRTEHLTGRTGSTCSGRARLTGHKSHLARALRFPSRLEMSAYGSHHQPDAGPQGESGQRGA